MRLPVVDPGRACAAPAQLHPTNIVSGVEQTLRRMRTDCLDLVQFTCSPSGRSSKPRALATLIELQDRAKSASSACQARCPISRNRSKWDVFDVFQIPYSAIQNEHEELISRADEERRWHGHPRWRGARRRGRGQELAGRPAEPGPGPRPAQLGDLRHAPACWPTRACPAWSSCCASRSATPGLSTTIVGTSNPAHLAGNIAVAEKGPLPADLYEEAKKRLPVPDATSGAR